MTSEPYTTKFYTGLTKAEGGPLNLSVFISGSAFMYAIFSENYKVVTELCHVEFSQLSDNSNDLSSRISHLIKNYQLNQKKFVKVNISILNQFFTISPEAFYSEEVSRELLSFATGANNVKQAFHHKIASSHYTFSLDTELSAFLERTFPNASIRHAGGVTLSLLFSQHSLQLANLYLHVSDGFIELAAKENNRLLFYNVFPFTASEDILYYLLFAMEQLELNPLTVKLCISGERELSDELIKTIKKYIKQVSFAVHHPEIKLEGELASLPLHYYFTLLNQQLCEL